MYTPIEKTVLLDFDGTIYSRGRIDVNYLQELSKKYNRIIVASNNSSIAHSLISKSLNEFCDIFLLTPQLLARSLVKVGECRISTYTTFEVGTYIHSLSTDKDLELNRELDEIMSSWLKEMKLKDILIVGKTRHGFVDKDAYLSSNSKVVALNLDRAMDSNMPTTSPLTGDLIHTDLDLGKTSKPYIRYLLKLSQYYRLEFEAVIGDNEFTDGSLARKLQTPFVHRRCTL